MSFDESKLRDFLIEVGLAVNAKCRESFESSKDLSAEVKESPADIIYRVDIEAEEVIVSMMESRASEFGGITLLAEGIGENDFSVYPKGIDPKYTKVKIICDPIDGSRGLMYGKRPAFFLAAGGHSSARTLNDLTVSVMVELPIPKQGSWDVLSAVLGQGFNVQRYNDNGFENTEELHLSTKTSIEGAFFSIVKSCYPGKDFIASIEEELLDKIFANRDKEFLPVFDDQYICTGGQLYELICGHDCFVGDFRSVMYEKFSREGKRIGQVSHPYDMAGLLIGREAGLIITDAYGSEFDAPLEMLCGIDWFGYANEAIQNQIEKPLLSILESRGLFEKMPSKN